MLCGWVLVSVSKWFIVPASKQIQNSGFRVGFKAVSVLAKWPGFKLAFKVCFSIGIFPSSADVWFQTGFVNYFAHWHRKLSFQSKT